MRKNFNDFVMIRGQIVQDEKGIPITWGRFAVQALESGAGKEGMSGQRKVEIADLAERIMAGGAIELSIDQLKDLKDAFGATFTAPPLVKAAWSWLEASTDPLPRIKAPPDAPEPVTTPSEV